MLKHLPKNAKLIRKCLKTHWALDLKQDLSKDYEENDIGAESIFNNPRFKLKVDHTLKRYMMTTLETTNLSDVMDSETNDKLTKERWEQWIRKLHKEQLRQTPKEPFVKATAIKIEQVIKQIPSRIIQQMRKKPKYTPEHVPNTVIL